MSLTRVRLLIVVTMWAVFLGALYGGMPPLGHVLRPVMWVALVLLSVRVVLGWRSNKRL